jgi:hypothetical protein
VGSNVELLVLGAFEVLGSELHQEGAPVEPLLRGEPMEPEEPNSPIRYALGERRIDRSHHQAARWRRRDLRGHVQGRGMRGKYRSMRMFPSELAKSTASIILFSWRSPRPASSSTVVGFLSLSFGAGREGGGWTEEGGGESQGKEQESVDEFGPSPSTG